MSLFVDFYYVDTPPKGLVTLHTIEEIVSSRLEYLNVLKVDKAEVFNGKFEYLLEGSIHDCIGHFTLRALMSKTDELFSYWIRKETLLLKHRLSVIRTKQLYKLFRTILRHVKRRENSKNPVDDVLVDICTLYSTPKVFKHIVSKSHAEDCTVYHHNINFQLLPDLVETRAIELSKGSARVYCSQWKDVIQSLFQTFIFLEIKNQHSLADNILADPRFSIINRKLQHQLFAKGYSCGRITASNIDHEVFNFPPCMAHLHSELRRKHRLSHYARFYYTLFLKECGMSLEESFLYWKQEYSKPHSCKSACVHDWQTDVKKFTYSIRHMYGLEGGRKNYKTPSCRGIREHIPSAIYEGGCPFENFDKESLRMLLLKFKTESEVEHFMKYNLNQNPQVTCANFFKSKCTANVKDISITKPVQYYMQITDSNRV